MSVIRPNRYKIVEGSQSAHCCFEYTIVDTHKPEIIGGEHWKNDKGELTYQSICECFGESEAKEICNALNKVHNDTLATS